MGIKIMFKSLFKVTLVIIFAIMLQPNIVLAKSSDNILIFRAYGEKFAQTYQGIEDDLGNDFNLIEIIIEPETSVNSIGSLINVHTPKIIVLIGNTPTRLYTKYQKQNPQKVFPPSMVMSALYVDRLLSQMKNAQGIRHEIPAVTSISNIRSLVKLPIKRVGVLYRQWMREYIELNSAFCQQEGIELVAVEIPNSISVKNLSYHLRHLLKKNIDALWIANDNRLIST